MPPFHTREPGKLESCLAEPFQTFNGKYLHRTFWERAAVLFYLITKNHCFSNGNKRMAVTLTTSFCYINKRWLKVPPKELYEIACSVAESDPKKKHIYQTALVATFKEFAVPFPWGKL
jgi:death-on-curing family protein